MGCSADSGSFEEEIRIEKRKYELWHGDENLMQKELIEHIKSEWRILSKAPVVIVLSFILAFSVAYTVAALRFTSILKTMQQRLLTSEERIQAKEELLNEYRQRLHILETTRSDYSRMTNDELKAKALSMVSDIRNFFIQAQDEQKKLILFEQQLMLSARTEEERKQASDLLAIRLPELSYELNVSFSGRFKDDSILLRDELLSRLPKGVERNESHLYEYPVYPLGVATIADELEQLAKGLP